jgi:hypothetical protein
MNGNKFNRAFKTRFKGDIDRLDDGKSIDSDTTSVRIEKKLKRKEARK